MWRFYFCPLCRIDDLSHWGLVARHLLRHDRLPRSGDDYVFFQNYPLGTACFIYYVGRFTENTEGIYFVAQNFLLGMLYAPVFSLIRKRRSALLPISAALFFLLFHYFRFMIYLQVDLVLSFFGIGMAACAVRYRRDLGRALLSVLPAMIAVTFIKNSGLFFAFASAAMLVYIARQGGARAQKLLAHASFALPLLAFLLWELHSKLSFPNAMATKHAVSLTAYAQQGSSKGLRVIARIALNQLRALLPLRSETVIAAAVMLSCSLLLMAATRGLPEPRRRRFRRCLALAVAVYFVWYFLVFLMYIFSMPTSEALRLASFYRYNGTGLAYLIGLTAILLFEALQSGDALPRLTRWVGMLCPLFIAAIIALTAWPGGAKLSKMFERDTQLLPLRAELQRIQRECGLPDGARILGFWPSDSNVGQAPNFAYYTIKYEYETDDIILITNDPGDPNLYYVGANADNLPAEEERGDAETFEGQTSLEELQHGSHSLVSIRDAGNFVARRLDGVDAFVIFGDSPDFEARIAPALANCGAEIPVYRVRLGD